MKKVLLLSIAILLLMPNIGRSQGERFKALFIYNFTKFLQWPENNRSGDFVIAVYGSTSMTNALKKITKGRKVGNQSIVIKKIQVNKPISDCLILYIPKDNSKYLSTILKKTKERHILVITTKPGLVEKGSCVNFVVKGGKLNFEMSLSNIESQGIKVRKSLTDLACKVY